MSGFRAFERIMVVVTFGFAVLSLIATAQVMFGHIPPVVNRSVSQYRLLNVTILVVLSAVIGALSLSFVTPRWLAARRVVMLIFTFLLTLEGLLFLFDHTVVSVAGSPIASAFRNIHAGGEVIYLPQPTPLSPYGFRTPRAEPVEKTGYRVLFLGNSYVEGSGSTFATNYPQAVEAFLRKALPGRNVTVFSAGVDGFGMKEDLILYQYLIDQHFTFDAVVVNFMLGSDPTNDIPGTIRKAIAGQPQRLHESRFLRVFYPFNSYIFRYLVYLDATFNERWADPSQARGADARCTMSSQYASYSRERALEYYGPGAPHRLYMDYNLDKLAKLADLVGKSHAKLFLVLLPDPNALLLGDRSYFGRTPMDWSWTRRMITDRVGGSIPTFDLSADFADRPDLFRCNDSHWNDAGNVAGARSVADFLAKQIGAK